MSCWMSSSRVQIDLHRAIDLAGDLHRLGDAVDIEPAAEAAAEQVIVDLHLLRRQAGDLRGRRLRAAHDLRADPDVAAILAHMNRAVHRLHGWRGREAAPGTRPRPSSRHRPWLWRRRPPALPTTPGLLRGLVELRGRDRRWRTARSRRRPSRCRAPRGPSSPRPCDRRPPQRHRRAARSGARP